MPDKKVVLLSDVLPTAWHATELGGVGKGDRVAIWGAGPGMICPASCRQQIIRVWDSDWISRWHNL